MIAQCTRVYQGLFGVISMVQNIYMSNKEALHYFQAGLLYEVKINVLVWQLIYLEVACKIANRVDCIL